MISLVWELAATPEVRAVAYAEEITVLSRIWLHTHKYHKPESLNVLDRHINRAGLEIAPAKGS